MEEELEETFREPELEEDTFGIIQQLFRGGEVKSLNDKSLEEGETFEVPQLNEWQKAWRNLVEYVSITFSDPDIEAIRIIFSCYAAHLHNDESEPAWLFLIGASGTGKTQLCLNPLYQINGSYEIDDVTDSTFVSGYSSGKGGLLNKIVKDNGGNAVFLFPDFTTILSKDESAIKLLLGQLRRMYDGRFTKMFGNSDEQAKWNGKITCIAACTPAIEEIWGKYREFGERFLSVRWKEPRDIDLALRHADRNSVDSRKISERYRVLVEKIIDPINLEGFRPELTDAQSSTLHTLASIVAKLQVDIKYDYSGVKMISIGTPNFPMRINSCIRQIAKGSAMLDRRTQLIAKDIKLAIRVAFDSIPFARKLMLNEIMQSPELRVAEGDMKRACLKHLRLKSAYSKLFKEMRSLGVVITKMDERDGEIYIGLTEEFEDLLTKNRRLFVELS